MSAQDHRDGTTAAPVPFGMEEADRRTTDPNPAESAGGGWRTAGQTVFDASGRAMAAARSVEEARRIAAAMNAVYGVPTEALEAWTSGRILDPVNDLLGELESIVPLPSAEERRNADRRRRDRRRPPTEVPPTGR